MAEPVPKMPAEWELTPASEEADPFRYGWRPRYVRLPGGKVEEQRIPLTAEDLLDPQLGDVILEGDPHAKLSSFLYVLLVVLFEKDAGVLVTHDVKMLWGIPGLKEPAPDIAVIRGARAKDEVRECFDVVQQGVRPCLLIEVVSPKYEEVRRNDYVRKKEIYERAGIPEYLIVEQYQVPGGPIRQWTGYRLGFDGRYQRIESDGEGRLLSETTGLLFGIDEDRSFLVINARTGERLLNQSQLSSARNAAEERAAQEAEARGVAEEARIAAEQRAAREAGARKVAEEHSARDAEARIAAEQRAAQEAEARKTVEAELALLRAKVDGR
ncbi:MAG: Uma2 family endonuclease [Acidobacteria bacterium]|nr:Uma2 family endonuclease [Acidobacteriota bacterium]